MKRVLSPLLLLMLALPAYGQEQPAETTPDAAPADTGAVIDSISTDATAESAPAEPEETATIPVDTPAEPDAPLRLYGGIDWVRNTLSSDAAKFDTGMYRLRFGTRVFDQLSIEAHYGINRSVNGKTGVDTDNYYGLFVMPNAVLFNTVELAFPVGYAKYKVSRGNSGESVNSVAYGMNIELPLRSFTPDLPDLRFVVGGMVYSQKVDARIYGYNAGLRYGFDVNGFHMGNPFSGLSGAGDKIGGFFKGLWPFGKDEAAPQ